MFITNADVLLTDNIAKMLMEPNQISYNKVVKYFGDEILNDNKTINRKMLADIVFNNKDKLKLLNSLTHPDVINYAENYISNNKDHIIVIESALLFETALKDICNITWYIKASKENRIQRLKIGRNYSDEKIKSMMKSQKPDSFYESQADITLLNDDFDTMQRDVYRIMNLHLHYIK